MRETMLHFDDALAGEQRERLCTAFGERGIRCDTAAQSAKPHLFFVAYDETRTAPDDLVRIAAEMGHHARVVDL